MPRYTGPIEIDGGGAVAIDPVRLPPAFTEDLGTSRFSGRWIGAGINIRKTWHDIGATGDNWGQLLAPKLFFQLDSANDFGILIISAIVHTFIGGTGNFTIGLGTAASPSFRNIINPGALAAGGGNHRLGTDAGADYDGSFSAGRRMDNVTNNQLYVYWDGTALTSGPTGSVSVSVLGVVVPDPKVAGS